MKSSNFKSYKTLNFLSKSYSKTVPFLVPLIDLLN